jgi:hypothetical protein
MRMLAGVAYRHVELHLLKTYVLSNQQGDLCS